MTDSPHPVFDEAAFAALHDSKLAGFQMAWSVFLLRFTALLRSKLGNLDDALLLTAISMASTLREDPADASEGFHAPNGPYAEKEPPPTNAVRLAEITGIPRETVRRRLVEMSARGWVEQSGPPRREWRLAIAPGGWPSVAQEMAALHRDLLREKARLLGRWDRLAVEAGWDALTRPPGSSRPAASPPAAPRANGAAPR